jgi:hypothetical protein
MNEISPPNLIKKGTYLLVLGRNHTKMGDPPSLFSGAAYLKNIRRKMIPGNK